MEWYFLGMLVGAAHTLRGNYTLKECGNIGKIGDGRIVVEEFFVKMGFFEDGAELGYIEMVGNSTRLKRQIAYFSEGGDQI